MTNYSYEITIDEASLGRLEMQLSELRELTAGDGKADASSIAKIMDSILETSKLPTDAATVESLAEIQIDMEILQKLVRNIDINPYVRVDASAEMDEEEASKVFLKLLEERFAGEFTKINQIHDAVTNVNNFIGGDLTALTTSDTEVLKNVGILQPTLKNIVDEIVVGLGSKMKEHMASEKLSISSEDFSEIMGKFITEKFILEAHRERAAMIGMIDDAMTANENIIDLLQSSDDLQYGEKQAPHPAFFSPGAEGPVEEKYSNDMTNADYKYRLEDTNEDLMSEKLNLMEGYAEVSETSLNTVRQKRGAPSQVKAMMKFIVEQVADKITKLTAEYGTSDEVDSALTDTVEKSLSTAFSLGGGSFDYNNDDARKIADMYQDMGWKHINDMYQDIMKWVLNYDLDPGKQQKMEDYLGKSISSGLRETLAKKIGSTPLGTVGTILASTVNDIFPESDLNIDDEEKLANFLSTESSLGSGVSTQISDLAELKTMLESAVDATLIGTSTEQTDILSTMGSKINSMETQNTVLQNILTALASQLSAVQGSISAIEGIRLG